VTKKAVLRHIAVGAPVLPGFDLNYWYALLYGVYTPASEEAGSSKQ
jgi:hypothetical protein